jgi:hypothetical protein
MGARADSVRDQALPASRHIGVTPTPLDGKLDGSSGEIVTPLPPRLVIPASMAQRDPCKRDSPARSIGCTPDDGAESPALVMDPTLSIDTHGTRLGRAWDGILGRETCRPSPKDWLCRAHFQVSTRVLAVGGLTKGTRCAYDW